MINVVLKHFLSIFGFYFQGCCLAGKQILSQAAVLLQTAAGFIKDFLSLLLRSFNPTIFIRLPRPSAEQHSHSIMLPPRNTKLNLWSHTTELSSTVLESFPTYLLATRAKISCILFSIVAFHMLWVSSANCCMVSPIPATEPCSFLQSFQRTQ